MSERNGSPSPARTRAVPATALLLAVLLAVNGVAVWGILSARESAEREALRDLGLTTAAQARALEAALASLAGDVIFLSQTPALVGAPEAMASDDPMVVRWARVGAEGGLLLFLEAHDEVERVVARTPGGEALVAVGRREGAPAVLPPESAAAAPTPERPLHVARWPLGPRERPEGELVVWIVPHRLLAAAVPGGGAGAAAGELAVEPLPVPSAADGAPQAVHAVGAAVAVGEAGMGDGGGGGFSAGRDEAGRVRVSALVLDEGWDPPLRWELVRTVPADSLVRTFDQLAARYRTTLVVNLGVVTLTLVLAWLAFREVRRSARLAAENAQQARVRDLERQVLHSERLAGVGRLAAGMAHEINNPLEGMSNYLNLLEDDLARGDVESARELAGRVRQGLDRAAGITRRVLEYSEPGRSPKRLLDLRRTVTDAVGFVQESGAFDGVEIAVEAPEEAQPVRANATTLGQLFLNLLLNACEAQPEDGRVTVRLRRVEGERGGPARARVSIEDRGPGIPEEALPHLFEPFFSTRGSTGLGLAVCHGVVQDHGGEIRAANRPGGGAELVVELPLAGAGAPGGGAGAEPEADNTRNEERS